MLTVRSSAALRAALSKPRAAGRRIALVPTMGGLHEGHLSLVRKALIVGDLCVVSIFVNPFQFGAGEDFDSYPRTLDSDSAALAALGVDVLFVPAAAEIYPDGPDAVTRVEVPELGGILCGASRPTFFRGVTTVVTVLFNMVQPKIAVFGEKDFQQLRIIERLVRDLHLPVEIVAAPTVREPDGLAMSSRNTYLSTEERQRAPHLYRVLRETRDAIRGGDRDFQAIGFRSMEALEAEGLRPDYVSVRRSVDLGIPRVQDTELVILGAGTLGTTRLIDNLIL